MEQMTEMLQHKNTSFMVKLTNKLFIICFKYYSKLVNIKILLIWS